MDGAYAQRNASTENHIEVDYDLNPTELYQSICNSDWGGALVALEKNPLECRTWVVKRDPYSEDQDASVRFLPLHSACAREPPLDVIIGLLTCYPEGASVIDDNGMLPLHYACANQASAAVIELLLLHNQEANRFRVQMSGSLPIHLAAQWGVSSPAVMDILLAENNSLACAKDNDECTPLELAMISEDYRHRDEVIEILRKAFEKEVLNDGDDSTISTHFSAIQQLKRRHGRHSIVFTTKSVDSGNSRNMIMPKKSLDTAEKMMAELDAMREEIVELRATKALQVESTREQIEREWGAVKDTLDEMKRQSQENSEKTDTLRDATPRVMNKNLRQSRTIDHVVSKIDSSGWLSLSQDRFGTKQSSMDSYISYGSTYEDRDDLQGGWDGDVVSRQSHLDQFANLFLKPLLPSMGKKKSKIKTPSRAPLRVESSKSAVKEDECNKEVSPRKLEDILQENLQMEEEIPRLKAKRDAYKKKMKSMEEIILEMSEGVSLLIKTNEETKKKIIRLENNVKETTRARRDMLKDMLREMADSYQQMKETRPQGADNCLRKQKSAIGAMDSMLSELRREVV